MRNLQDFSTEILESVFEHVAEQDASLTDLKAVSLVCKRFNGVALKSLFKSVRFSLPCLDPVHRPCIPQWFQTYTQNVVQEMVLPSIPEPDVMYYILQFERDVLWYRPTPNRETMTWEKIYQAAWSKEVLGESINAIIPQLPRLRCLSLNIGELPLLSTQTLTILQTNNCRLNVTMPDISHWIFAATSRGTNRRGLETLHNNRNIKTFLPCVPLPTWLTVRGIPKIGGKRQLSKVGKFGSDLVAKFPNIRSLSAAKCLIVASLVHLDRTSFSLKHWTTLEELFLKEDNASAHSDNLDTYGYPEDEPEDDPNKRIDESTFLKCLNWSKLVKFGIAVQLGDRSKELLETVGPHLTSLKVLHIEHSCGCDKMQNLDRYSDMYHQHGDLFDSFAGVMGLSSSQCDHLLVQLLPIIQEIKFEEVKFEGLTTSVNIAKYLGPRDDLKSFSWTLGEDTMQVPGQADDLSVDATSLPELSRKCPNIRELEFETDDNLNDQTTAFLSAMLSQFPRLVNLHIIRRRHSGTPITLVTSSVVGLFNNMRTRPDHEVVFENLTVTVATQNPHPSTRHPPGPTGPRVSWKVSALPDDKVRMVFTSGRNGDVEERQVWAAAAPASAPPATTTTKKTMTTKTVTAASKWERISRETRRSFNRSRGLTWMQTRGKMRCREHPLTIEDPRPLRSMKARQASIRVYDTLSRYNVGIPGTIRWNRILRDGGDMSFLPL